MGTPAFMPPEQARGRWEQIDGRSDLWAVGATMFVALTGRQVHEGETVNEELLAAMTVPAQSLREAAPFLPAPLIDLVDRALAFEQDDRWSDARAMQAAVRTVQALLDDLPVPSDGSSPSLPDVDSARPVTLLTPHPIVASTFRTIPAPESTSNPRRPIMFGGSDRGRAGLGFGCDHHHQDTGNGLHEGPCPGDRIRSTRGHSGTDGQTGRAHERPGRCTVPRARRRRYLTRRQTEKRRAPSRQAGAPGDGQSCGVSPASEGPATRKRCTAPRGPATIVDRSSRSS